MPAPGSRSLGVAVAAAGIVVLAACAGSTTGQSAASGSPAASQTPSPTPTSTSTAAAGSARMIAYSRFTNARLTAAVISVGSIDGGTSRQLTGDGASVVDADPIVVTRRHPDRFRPAAT